MKIGILLLWCLSALLVCILLINLYKKRIFEFIRYILEECWQFIKPVETWQKIIVIVVVFIIAVIFTLLAIGLISSKGLIIGIAYLLSVIFLWMFISILSILIARDSGKILNEKNPKVADRYSEFLIIVLFISFITFPTIFDIIFNRNNSLGEYIHIVKILHYLVLIIIFVLHLQYIYFWLRHPKEMVIVYASLSKINLNKEPYPKIFLLLRIVLWNTYYLFLEFIVLISLYEALNNKLCLQQIYEIFLKIFSEVIGVSYENNVNNLAWMIFFEGWAKIVFFIVIGTFIINYLLTEKDFEHQ